MFPGMICISALCIFWKWQIIHILGVGGWEGGGGGLDPELNPVGKRGGVGVGGGGGVGGVGGGAWGGGGWGGGEQQQNHAWGGYGI